VIKQSTTDVELESSNKAITQSTAKWKPSQLRYWRRECCMMKRLIQTEIQSNLCWTCVRTRARTP